MIYVPKLVSEQDVIKRCLYWNAYMLGQQLRAEEATEITVALMVSTGGFGYDEGAAGSRRSGVLEGEGV